MRFGWLAACLAVLLAVATVSQASAQLRGPAVITAQDELPDEETPGVVPEQQEAAPQFQKQVVFFRPTKSQAPSSSIPTSGFFIS